jgi:FtsH-binding integral membrane protein
MLAALCKKVFELFNHDLLCTGFIHISETVANVNFTCYLSDNILSYNSHPVFCICITLLYVQIKLDFVRTSEYTGSLL